MLRTIDDRIIVEAELHLCRSKLALDAKTKANPARKARRVCMLVSYRPLALIIVVRIKGRERREFKEHGYLWWRSLLVSLCRGAPRRDRGRRDYSATQHQRRPSFGA